jgi:predicted GIY-YIG superfamily endonuclease
MNGPVELVYVEEVPDHGTALKREVEIKKMGHGRKAELAKANDLPAKFCQQGSGEEG